MGCEPIIPSRHLFQALEQGNIELKLNWHKEILSLIYSERNEKVISLSKYQTMGCSLSFVLASKIHHGTERAGRDSVDLKVPVNSVFQLILQWSYFCMMIGLIAWLWPRPELHSPPRDAKTKPWHFPVTVKFRGNEKTAPFIEVHGRSCSTGKFLNHTLSKKTLLWEWMRSEPHQLSPFVISIWFWMN